MRGMTGSTSMIFGASNFGRSEKNSRTSRAYSIASSGLTVWRLIVTLFCPVSICPQFRLKLNDSQSFVDRPKRASDVLTSLRFHLQALSVRPDAADLG